MKFLKVPVISADDIPHEHYIRIIGFAHGCKEPPVNGYSVLISTGCLRRHMEEEGHTIPYIVDILKQLPGKDVLFVLYRSEDKKLVQFCT